MTDDLKKLAEAEAALGQVIDQRDSYHEWADRLAYAIGGSEIGEHSSINNPWQNAIEMAEDLRTRAEAAEASLSEKEATIRELAAELQARPPRATCGDDCHAASEDPNCILEGQFMAQVEELRAALAKVTAELDSAKYNADVYRGMQAECRKRLRAAEASLSEKEREVERLMASIKIAVDWAEALKFFADSGTSLAPALAQLRDTLAQEPTNAD